MSLFGLLFGTGGSPLSVTANPSRMASGGTTAAVTSGTVSAVVSDGVAPFSYLWTIQSFDSAPPTILTPTGSATSFRWTGIETRETREAVARVTVTDANGAVAHVDIVITHSDNRTGPIS